MFPRILSNPAEVCEVPEYRIDRSRALKTNFGAIGFAYPRAFRFR
jgi:hypothetical protein